MFDSVKKQLNSNPVTSLLTNPNKYPFAAINRTIAERFILLILNTLLYLQSDKAIIEHVGNVGENGSSKKRKKKSNRKKSSPPYVRVGKSITIDPKQKNMYAETNELKLHKTNRYHSQWIVRGHWRNQAYGEGFKERKVIWIRPYVKGSGEIEDKPYTIK